MSRLHKSSDEVFTNTLVQNGPDEVVGLLQQPSDEIILERNKQLRNNPGAQRDLTFGRQITSIPMIDWLVLKKKYPKIADYSDPVGRSAEIMRIMRLPENRKYLVRDKKQGRI
jgi:hypothetical protein